MDRTEAWALVSTAISPMAAMAPKTAPPAYGRRSSSAPASPHSAKTPRKMTTSRNGLSAVPSVSLPQLTRPGR